MALVVAVACSVKLWYHQRRTHAAPSACCQAKARTIYDILNEPDARGLGWDRITDIYLDTMDAINAVNSQVLLRLTVP